MADEQAWAHIRALEALQADVSAEAASALAAALTAVQQALSSRAAGAYSAGEAIATQGFMDTPASTSQREPAEPVVMADHSAAAWPSPALPAARAAGTDGPQRRLCARPTPLGHSR